jgi:pyridinium-3,5-biscarboxylic acid mononucleotide synthase
VQHSPLDDALGAFAELSGDSRVDGSHLDPDLTPLIANGQARPDLRREERTGAPEVIYASGKDTAQIIALTQTFVERTGRAIISRIRDIDAEQVIERFSDYETTYNRRAATLVVRERSFTRPVGGNVGIVTAGTSDLPVAEQAKVIAEEMGCQVTLVSDVGVAGLHRLFGPLRALLDSGVDVIVVCAGMDGALPSVVSGLVNLPVIGVPTSTGYGVGGNGVAALLSMLQTCAPGLAVVNVDNGVGAGVTAALIANRVAGARST